MQEAAGRFALQMPPETDYHALSWLVKTLIDDDEFEQFFDALPSLFDSEALADAQGALIEPNEEILSHALIGMMDRTLLSELVSEEVKQRRIIICTKTVGATSLLGPGWTLQRVLCGEWHGFSRSIHFGLCVQDWKNTSHPLLAFYVHCAVAVTLTSVQKRDDHWFRLASGQLNQSKTLLRNYFAEDDSILLDDAIFIIRRAMQAFLRSKDYQRDIREASSKTLELICSFNIKKTLEVLQHQFCSLWNDLVVEAEMNSDPDFRSLCIMMLKSIRRLYITLHENTASSPTAFSTTTDDSDRVLGFARSYPICRNDSHHPSRPVSESKPDEPPRNAPHVTASLVGVVSTSVPVMPLRLTTPPTRMMSLDAVSPFRIDRNPPNPYIPSPYFPVSPQTGPSNPSLSGSYPYPSTLRSPRMPQMDLPDEYIPPDMGFPPPPESPLNFSRTDSISQRARPRERVLSSIPEDYPRQAYIYHRPSYESSDASESDSTSSSELPMIDIVPPSPTETLSDISQTDINLSSDHAARHVHFAPSPPDSPTFSLESLDMDMAPESREYSPPESPLVISQMTFHAEDAPAVISEVHSQQGDYIQSELLETPPTSPSESLGIVVKAPSPESSPPGSPWHSSPMALSHEDVLEAMGEFDPQQGARVRFAPSESTSTPLSESPAIDIVTPPRPESPYISAIPIPPTPAGSRPSIDASLDPPKTLRMTAALLPGEIVPITVGRGGNEPISSAVVSAGVVAQAPMEPPDSVLVDPQMTISQPSPSVRAPGRMAPVLKFNGYGELAGLLYHSPHSVIHEDDLYPTALHLFEAHKFLYHRPDLAEKIRQCERVEEVIALSAKHGEFVRRDWGNVALSTVSNRFFLYFYPYFALRVYSPLNLC